jgi:hypothetical protein
MKKKRERARLLAKKNAKPIKQRFLAVFDPFLRKSEILIFEKLKFTVFSRFLRFFALFFRAPWIKPEKQAVFRVFSKKNRKKHVFKKIKKEAGFPLGKKTQGFHTTVLSFLKKLSKSTYDVLRNREY